MTEVVLIRPGSTDFDEQHRIQGSLDLPLNARGEQQVADIVEQLRGVPLEVLCTAPGEPARSTAEAVGRNLAVSVKKIEALRNLHQGLWQGLQIDDLRRKHPKVFKRWKDSPETIRPPEGETVDEALGRIRKALHKPLKRKSSFGVVVSEPLATLVRCVLQGCKPELPGPVRRVPAPPLVERLQVVPAKPGRAGSNGGPPSSSVSSPEGDISR